MIKNKHPLQQIVDNELCMGCGFCVEVCPEKAITMVYNQKFDGFVPEINSNISCGSNCLCADFCPGENLDMKELVEQKFRKSPENYLVGNYHSVNTGYAADKSIRKNSSSGGLIPAVLKYLFETGQIDAAYTVVPSKDNPYNTGGKFIKNVDEISSIHGSVYHPVNFGAKLDELTSFDGKFAFVGLPCQLGALEKYKQINPRLKDNLVLTMGLFCGGMNKFDAWKYYLEGFREDFRTARNINFRHGYWPGDIRIENAQGEEKIIPRGNNNSRTGILRYVASVDGYFMLKRCRLCPDQISDLADIAVGDPHLPKFKLRDSDGYSIIISRTEIGARTISEMQKQNQLVLEKSTVDDVINSQNRSLLNRRHITPYVKVTQWLGKEAPRFNIDNRAVENVSITNFFYAFRDLIKIYYFKYTIFRPFYLMFQVFDYLLMALNSPKRFVKRLLSISVYLKK